MANVRHQLTSGALEIQIRDLSLNDIFTVENISTATKFRIVKVLTNTVLIEPVANIKHIPILSLDTYVYKWS